MNRSPYEILQAGIYRQQEILEQAERDRKAEIVRKARLAAGEYTPFEKLVLRLRAAFARPAVQQQVGCQ